MLLSSRLSSLAGFGLMLPLTLLLAACQDETPPPAPPRAAIVVEAEPKTMVLSGESSGQIEARFTSSVGFLVSGRLISRNVDVGKVVKTGDLLAQIDPTDFQNNQTAAQAQVASAQAEVTQTTGSEERFRKLLADGFTTQAEYDQKKRDLDTAKAQLQGAQANLRVAEDQLKYTQLLAPIDGSITRTGADAGQVVQAGQMVVEIAKDGEKDAVFAVSSEHIAFAHLDMPIKVWLQGRPDVAVTGHVREIAPNADPVTGTYQVKVGLTNPPPALRLGAIVVGEASIEGKGLMTQLPSTALLQTGDTAKVWVVTKPDNTVKTVPVKVARYDADNVLISEGLNKGDLVVALGVNSLAQGQKVEPQIVDPSKVAAQ